jgi:hypothetical protein
MWHSVVWKKLIDVSEELTITIFKPEETSKQTTSKKQAERPILLVVCLAYTSMLTI